MPLIDKIINLIKKTGDKCIIIDQKSEDALVILTFEEYEKLKLSGGKPDEKLLTENEWLDKINRDIALKISEEKQLEADRDISDEEGIPKIPREEGKEEGEERFYFEPIE
jgi:hypothetical protein